MVQPKPAIPSRRPLKTRGRAWARTLAAWLTTRGVPPNAISAFSLVPAAGAGLCFLLLLGAGTTASIVLLLLAAGCIQLRLLANMLDGMVAVEGGRRTASGDLWNEIPDRVADVMILAPVGYALPWIGTAGITMGWIVALLAVLTAYVRVVGGSLGVAQSFVGPMAKPQRMAILTAACLLSILEVLSDGYGGRVLAIALVAIGAGALVTCARRLDRIVSELRERSTR